MNDESLHVTSHVARDLLSSAASFKNEAAVVWEYVVNSLQYVDRSVKPRVQVFVKPRKKEILISDNGQGMTRDTLGHFFQMHGENPDRLKGKLGRGKFGTGKSAAFGIGNVLRVETIKDGLRNAVELTRDVIECSDGSAIPVDWKVIDEPTHDSNGTTIQIADIFLPTIRTRLIAEYIERHLQAFRTRDPQVAVNNHLCVYKPPKISETRVFYPSASQANMLGQIELSVHLAAVPLDRNDQGVAITCGEGNLVAIETGGIETKEHGAYLFGEIDCPALEEFETPIEPFNATRDLQLNPVHPVAKHLIPFISSSLEEVRKLAVKRLREAEQSEQSRRLAGEANRIAEILNHDFLELKEKLRDIHSPPGTRGSVIGAFGNSGEQGDESDSWVEGTELPGDVAEKEDETSDQDSDFTPKNRPDPQISRSGVPAESGASSVDSAGTDGKKRGRPRGGFQVKFMNEGPDQGRSRYVPNELAIVINLDHPVVAAALQGSKGVEDVNFLRIVYEIAFVEYSFAFARELTEQDPDIPADDLLYEISETLNRVSGKAVVLYR